MLHSYSHVFGWEVPSLDNPEIKGRVLGHYCCTEGGFNPIACAVPWTRQ